MISKVNKWTLKEMDIENTFLEGDYETELNINLPKDLVKFITGNENKQICVKIKKKYIWFKNKQLKYLMKN
jgi:hypothetical protein